MAEEAGEEERAYRAAACRVLRARRKRAAPRRPRWRLIAGGAAAAPLMVAALWLGRVDATPAEPPPREPSAPLQPAPEVAEREPAHAEEIQIQAASAARPLTPWLVVAPERSGDGAALRVVSAAADNRFGLREGDLIIADCGESGRGPDADVSAALAGGYAACLDTERDGQRTTLISLLDGPGAPDPASPQHS
jgi:hypothetical protein